MRRVLAGLGAGIVLALWHPFMPVPALKSQVRVQTVAPTTAGAVRDWDNTVNSMVRTRELQVRLQRPDTLMPGRTLEQLDQYYNGVRVWGGGVSRQLDGLTAISIFGTIYPDIALDSTPTVTQQDAKSAIERAGGAELGPGAQPELVILPMEDGTLKLAWVGNVTTTGDRLQLFIDAKTGAELRRLSLRERQAPNAFVGRGLGVLGDDKKVSADAFNGTFIAFDTLRPPDISTFDLRSNLTKVNQFLNGVVALAASDYAVGPGNVWNDPAVVDAHVYSSETYDYYFKRFGRLGLDNANKKIWNIVHPVLRSAVFTASNDVFGTFYVNAFYAGDGVMVYGEGLPPTVIVTSTGQHWDYLAGALDVVAHELTHGVTEFTSNLIYQNESGALNEAFSDMMGTSVEFFFQPVGTGKLKADYLIAEDVVTAAVPGALDGIRSLANPALFGQPDHYSKRVIVPLSNDNGGVHTNMSIATHAFFLAIEGGTNRTSGITVQGVGAAHRDQIEKVFYRAFAQLMPSNATFATARVIALQAAQDLFGLNSAPFNAVRDAWTAVGVN